MGEIRFTARIYCIIKKIAVLEFKEVFLALRVSGKR
jgi:hypothetical protein